MDWKASLDGTFSDALTGQNLRRLVLVWLGGLTGLLAYGTIVAESCSLTLPGVASGVPSKSSETGPLTARWNEPGSNPVTCAVQFDTLRVDTPGDGTAKTVTIENLRVQVEHTLPGGDAGELRPSDFSELCGLLALTQRPGGPSVALLDRVCGNPDVCFVPVNLAGATGVRVRNLDWQVCRGNKRALRVQCERACLPEGSQYCVLSGGASVSTAAAKLESDRIVVRPTDASLVAEGPYALRRTGQTDFGLYAVLTPDLRRRATMPAHGGASAGVLPLSGRSLLDAGKAWVARCGVTLTGGSAAGCCRGKPWVLFAGRLRRDWAPVVALPVSLLTVIAGPRSGLTPEPRQQPIKRSLAWAPQISAPQGHVPGSGGLTKLHEAVSAWLLTTSTTGDAVDSRSRVSYNSGAGMEGP
jgi:hypothetical protein